VRVKPRLWTGPWNVSMPYSSEESNTYYGCLTHVWVSNGMCSLDLQPDLTWH